MPLTRNQYKQIQNELDSCKKPLFFFHDDPDGVCSFLQYYSYTQEGYGVIVKARPQVDTKFLKKVEDYKPDKIFILDLAMLEQDFVDQAGAPIIWVDHHPVQEIHNVKYYNPRKNDPQDNPCVAYLTYETVKQNLWLAMVGCIGDMHWPEKLVPEFRKKYLDLLPENITDARAAQYDCLLGKLVKIFSFVLKGTSHDAMKYVKALTRIKEPYEILNQENPRGKFIYKRFEQINIEYENLLKEALKCKPKGKVLLFMYKDNKFAFSSDLSNEMIHRFPDKIIILGRVHNGEIKCSFRSNDTVIPPLINQSLNGLSGYGGGHEYAAGACIKEDDFDEFIKNFKKNLKK